ncbi:MAG: DUF84 family protein [Candidatus Pacebacteria bacterium]|nr:DUF84 family protein [Candidatus Paceibacterota bacterium]
MIVLLGSESGQKMEILRGSLENLLTENFEIIPCPVDSGIAEQPLSAAITRQGAINRAMRATKACDGAYDFSFGLEAGLELVDGLYHFVCVAAILRSDDICSVGISGLTPLPKAASERVMAGEYLSGIIREYRDWEGLNDAEKEAVEDMINRRRGFAEAISNAWGESQI